MSRFLWTVLAGFTLVTGLQAQRCAVCDLGITDTSYLVTDQVTGQKKHVCLRCSELPARCYLCSLPVKDVQTRLPDGRVLCVRDSREVVLEENEAKQVCAETRRQLDRMFVRFFTFPATNVSLSFVDRVHMQELIQTPGFDRECPSPSGYVRSRPDEQDHPHHFVSLLSGLPRARLMATCAHEMTHCWVDENLPDDRRIAQDAVEGFCELVAFKLMEQLGHSQEMQVIRANLYTRGQIELFINADNTYGFYTVMEWILAGRDPVLSSTDPDQVRRRRERRQPPVSREPAPVLRQGPAAVPDTLTLVGISGAAGRRLALINDATLGEGESRKVRVGATNVQVRCLQIGPESVVLQVGGAEERQELRLKSK